MNQEEKNTKGDGDRLEVPIAIAIALITVIGAIAGTLVAGVSVIWMSWVTLF